MANTRKTTTTTTSFELSKELHTVLQPHQSVQGVAVTLIKVSITNNIYNWTVNVRFSLHDYLGQNNSQQQQQHYRAIYMLSIELFLVFNLFFFQIN